MSLLLFRILLFASASNSASFSSSSPLFTSSLVVTVLVSVLVTVLAPPVFFIISLFLLALVLLLHILSLVESVFGVAFLHFCCCASLVTPSSSSSYSTLFSIMSISFSLTRLFKISILPVYFPSFKFCASFLVHICLYFRRNICPGCSPDSILFPFNASTFSALIFVSSVFVFLTCSLSSRTPSNSSVVALLCHHPLLHPVLYSFSLFRFRFYHQVPSDF
mmetsp:Transcript_17156/g.19646  ORF Transcript_17156/g.19646 Transcript_17156/m.19646 type:complete len:220 (+) Transcript_17156:346-1005(+)